MLILALFVVVFYFGFVCCLFISALFVVVLFISALFVVVLFILALFVVVYLFRLCLLLFVYFGAILPPLISAETSQLRQRTELVHDVGSAETSQLRQRIELVHDVGGGGGGWRGRGCI